MHTYVRLPDNWSGESFFSSPSSTSVDIHEWLLPFFTSSTVYNARWRTQDPAKKAQERCLIVAPALIEFHLLFIRATPIRRYIIEFSPAGLSTPPSMDFIFRRVRLWISHKMRFPGKNIVSAPLNFEFNFASCKIILSR